MRILILLTYYNRPILVKNALNSVIASDEYHKDWVLVFGDDSSPVPGEPIAREILHNYLDKVIFVKSNLTIEDKINNGIVIGKYANELIATSNAEIGVTLGDDDELVPNYLAGLSKYFESNPNVMYCYSNVHVYNPLFQKSSMVYNTSGPYNRHQGPINPVNKVDTSQVAFRLDCCKKHGIKYPESTKDVKLPYIKNIDANFFQQLYDKFGDAQPSGLIAQYKGVHDYQLVWHKKGGVADMTKYMQTITELGGKRF